MNAFLRRANLLHRHRGAVVAVVLSLVGTTPTLAFTQDRPQLLNEPQPGAPTKASDDLLDPARTRAALEAAKKKRPTRSERAAGPVLAQAKPGATSKCKRPKGRFQFNADKEDIQSLLKRISQITCKNFIVSESVKGKSDITIISHRPVTTYQAEAAFLAALEANNMALVPAGAYHKVVERKDASKRALPMYESIEDLPQNDAQVTYLYELKYASRDQIQPLLRNLMSKSGDLQFAGNVMIITDAGSNIHRLVNLIDRMDVTGSSSRMHIVDIQWADAQQIAKKLQEIFKDAIPKGIARPRSAPPAPETGKAAAARAAEEAGDDVSIDKIIADERTNKLIVISSLRAFESVKDVIDLLDVPDTDRSTGTKIYVHALNNADAQKLASTLSSLAQGGAKAAKAKKGKGKAAAQAGQSASLFEGEVKITADDSTNSLVIISSPRDYKALQDVIGDLDQRRPQVFIEAAIMEVALTENRRVGLDAYMGIPATVPGLEGQGLGIIANEGGRNLVTSSAQALAAQQLFQAAQARGTIDPTQALAAVDAATALDSLIGVIGFQGPPIPETERIFGFPVPSFGAVLNALQSNANVNVLSTPHIMTTDNEKAEISVGQRIPVVRGISPVGGGVGGAFGGLQQVSYEDVKLVFAVTPHVNDAGEMRIEIEQEVSDLGGNVPIGNGLEQPIITNRSAKTTVVVNDQQTVVVGGLISDRSTDTESKIPILGDIPLFGWLFKNWSDSKGKTNLIIVLTPYVVNSQADFRKIYERKMKERKDFLETYYGVAREYNPYIDYEKKTGPMGKLMYDVDYELTKIENGGPGLPGEFTITPETDLSLIPEDDDDADAAPGTAPPPPESGAGDAADSDDAAGDPATESAPDEATGAAAESGTEG